MANTKISALGAGAALDGTEAIPAVQSASTVKVLVSAIRTYLLALANTFTGKVTVNTASGDIFDCQTAGASKFKVSEFGAITGPTTIDMGIGLRLANTGAKTQSGGSFSWSSAADITSAIDTAFMRKAAKVVEINSGTAGTYAGCAFSLGSQTVAQLPTAASAGLGAIACVSDASATTPRSTVAGGGANKVLVMSDATNWLIVA
jgi:hypothetical protein